MKLCPIHMQLITNQHAAFDKSTGSFDKQTHGFQYIHCSIFVQLYSSDFTILELGGQIGLYNCTSVQLYSCTIVQLYNGTTVQLYICITLQLYNCTTVQLHKCKIVQLVQLQYNCSKGSQMGLYLQLTYCLGWQIHHLISSYL